MLMPSMNRTRLAIDRPSAAPAKHRVQPPLILAEDARATSR
jgi:hypothetical protein